MARYEKQVKEVFKKCFHIQGEGGNNFFFNHSYNEKQHPKQNKTKWKLNRTKKISISSDRGHFSKHDVLRLIKRCY